MSELFAVLSASCAALSSILLGELKGRISLLQLICAQMIAAFLMTNILALAFDGWKTVGPTQLALLAGSGFAGIVVAGTAYVATIHAVGPRITALLFSLTSPITLLLGYIAFQETISHRQAACVALLMTGLVLAIGMPRRFSRGRMTKLPMPTPVPSAVPLSAVSAPPKLGSLLPGIGLGVLTAFGQSIGNLLARPAMATGVEPFSAMAIRCGVGALVFTLIAATPWGWRSNLVMDAKSWALVLGAAFFGTTVGMALLMAALSSGNTGVVATLSTMTAVLILPMVSILGREVPSTSAWFGAVLAIIGTGLISAG